MLSIYCPRLSEAKTLLPILRAQLVAASPRYALPIGISLDLLPIVEDGLFGYELPSPGPHTDTYLTIGFRATGEAVVRSVESCTRAPSALRLATRNGESVAGTNSPIRAVLFTRHDAPFGELSDAVDSGFSQLVAPLFPKRPRQPIELPCERASILG